jgi:hypothetical protein
VDVDEAGRHEAALCVYFLGAAPRDMAHLAYEPAFHADVTIDRVAAASVEDRAVANDQVVRSRHVAPRSPSARASR